MLKKASMVPLIEGVGCLCLGVLLLHSVLIMLIIYEYPLLFRLSTFIGSLHAFLPTSVQTHSPASH